MSPRLCSTLHVPFSALTVLVRQLVEVQLVKTSSFPPKIIFWGTQPPGVTQQKWKLSNASRFAWCFILICENSHLYVCIAEYIASFFARTFRYLYRLVYFKIHPTLMGIVVVSSCSFLDICTVYLQLLYCALLRARSFIRSFIHYCGQGSSLLWTPALRPLYRFNAPAQGEEGNW